MAETNPLVVHGAKQLPLNSYASSPLKKMQPANTLEDPHTNTFAGSEAQTSTPLRTKKSMTSQCAITPNSRGKNSEFEFLRTKKKEKPGNQEASQQVFRKKKKAATEKQV